MKSSEISKASEKIYLNTYISRCYIRATRKLSPIESELLDSPMVHTSREILRLGETDIGNPLIFIEDLS